MDALKQRNPKMECRKIAEHLALTFGIKINKDVVRRILEKYYPPSSTQDGPSWITVLGHSKDSLWSVDLFRCESILLCTFWVMVIIDVCTRRFIGFAIARDCIDGAAVCRLFDHAVSRQPLPKYLSTDNDPLFRFHRWRANLRILDIEEVKSIPFVPCSHPFVERLISTIRRDLLDRLLFWNQLDLERKLNSYVHYYNEYRCHTGLAGSKPNLRSGNPHHPAASLISYRWVQHCHGLFQTPAAA